MYKALVLVATICVSLVAANRRDSEINTRLALTVARRDALRREHGLGPYKNKNFRLTQEDGASTDGTDPPTDTGSTDSGVFGLLQGLVYGLQFSTSTESTCYTTVSESISAANDFTELIPQAWNPTKWATILQVASEWTDYLAGIQSNC